MQLQPFRNSGRTSAHWSNCTLPPGCWSGFFREEPRKGSPIQYGYERFAPLAEPDRSTWHWCHAGKAVPCPQRDGMTIGLRSVQHIEVAAGSHPEATRSRITRHSGEQGSGLTLAFRRGHLGEQTDRRYDGSAPPSSEHTTSMMHRIHALSWKPRQSLVQVVQKSGSGWGVVSDRSRQRS